MALAANRPTAEDGAGCAGPAGVQVRVCARVARLRAGARMQSGKKTASWVRVWLHAAVVAALVAPGVARANPFDVYGLGARSSAMGNVGTAVADDFSATYYNPAGLALATPTFNAGVLLTYDDVAIRLKDRPAGYDIPDLGSKSPLIPTKYRLNTRADTTDIPATYALQLGGVVSPWIDQLRLGFAVGLPLNSVGEQTARFSDEREQYFSNRLDFELLGHRQQQMSVLFGAGYRVTEWLAVGIGASLLPNSTTKSSVYLADSGHQDQIQMTVQNQQTWNPTVHAGLTVLPSPNWQFGLAWRGQNSFDMAIQNEVQIKGFQGTSSGFPIPQVAHFVLNFTPHQFIAGGAYKNGPMLVSLDVIRSLWSHYLDTVGELAGFNDTWSARLGAQWQATGRRSSTPGCAMNRRRCRTRPGGRTTSTMTAWACRAARGTALLSVSAVLTWAGSSPCSGFSRATRTRRRGPTQTARPA